MDEPQTTKGTDTVAEPPMAPEPSPSPDLEDNANVEDARADPTSVNIDVAAPASSAKAQPRTRCDLAKSISFLLLNLCVNLRLRCSRRLAQRRGVAACVRHTSVHDAPTRISRGVDGSSRVSIRYFFLCGLGLMGDSFKVLAGKFAGNLFQSVNHPVAGLMVGILATVLVLPKTEKPKDEPGTQPGNRHKQRNETTTTKTKTKKTISLWICCKLQTAKAKPLL